jgi:signal transduction histidine kinase
MPLHGSFKRRKATPRPTVAVSSTAELARHLIGAQEEERKRISRELHDGTGQGLMVLRLYLAMLASESQTPESLLKIQEALKLLDNTVEDLRRIIGRLSPRTLEELGLLAAIRKEARDLSRNSGMKAQLNLSPDLGPIDPEIEIAIFRSLQEALHNIAKHSQARNFTVHLTKADGSICLLVEDDGVGFSRKRNSGGRTFGVLGMRERISVLGGKVQIHSAKGKGTQIKISLPLPHEPERQHATAEHRVRPRLKVRESASHNRGQTTGRPRNILVLGGVALPAAR